MAILFAAPRFRATDKSNAPISGAFLQFFQYQTSTPQPVYTDSTLQIPLLNPVRADANGLFSEIWLDDFLPPYKVVFSSPDTNDSTLPGSIIWTIQQYNASFSVDALTLLLNPQSTAEIEGGVTPTNYAYAPGDIRRYGASLSASAAVNTTAIQSAQSGNFGVIYAPPGTFAYTGASVTNCTAYGLNALSKNGTGGAPGNNNTAFGTLALANLIGGLSNPTGSTAVGYLALTNSNGATMTAVGDNCFSSDVSGTDCTAVGAQAGFSQNGASVTGNNFFGFQCGYFITTGTGNCLFGNYAGGGINGPVGTTGITTGTGNCGFGGSTLANVGSGGSNSAYGTGALQSTTGGGNVALGYFAGNHANASGEFYLDNQDRGSNANEVANAPIYGNFGADAAHNRLRFNAQLSTSVGTLCSTNTAPTIASASIIAPTAAITFVSGTTAVTGITVPSWMNNGGRITLIPTGVWTWTTAINIALAGTAVVNKALDFVYDAGTSKWYPSYTS
jgi:hypothetical protein